MPRIARHARAHGLFRRLGLAILAMLSVSVTVARASDDVPKALQTWVEALQKSQSTIVAGSPFVATWTEEELALPPAPELASMRERVSGHPVHPDRVRLEAYERRTQHQDSRRISLWTGLGRARVATTPNWREDVYVDYAFTPDATWSMTPETLGVAPNNRQDPSHDFLIPTRDFVIRAASILSGGIAWMERSDLPLKVESYDGRVWTAHARAVDADGRECVLTSTGTWDTAANSGTVDHTNWAFSFHGKSGTTSFQSKNWTTPGTDLPFTFPRQLDQDQRDDEVNHRQYQAIDIHPIDAPSLRHATDVPEPNGTDVARGQKTFRSIVDYRVMTMVRTTDEGKTVTLPLAALPASAPRISLERHGWILAVSIVVLILALRLRASLCSGSGSS